MSMEKKFTTIQRGETMLDVYGLADQIAAIRADLQKLNSTVGRVVKDEATETKDQLEQTMQQNPLYVIGIALGLGFLFGAFIRR
jgi:ElaB/YqjD/DUF883 family membrane-anchored ribosome-binding protein